MIYHLAKYSQAEQGNRFMAQLPLAGIKVVEFTHMVMGPAVGVILADLGAEVTKIEPLQGDNTRRLKGSGAGYFAMYNRNKRSLCLDLKSEQGAEIARSLIADADVLIENFRPGAMEKLGFGYAAMSADNPRLIYCSAKGFLSGPYEHRTALDEVTQMMGGLAYMTGPPGQPLRAGSSVIDITGGMFGVIGVLAALEERHRTGQGQQVTSSLYETTAFMVGQHMAQEAVLGEIPPPMSVRRSAWAVYDIFETADAEKVFVGIVSDTQWAKFCEAFGFDELGADQELADNNGRVAARERIMPLIQAHFRGMSKQDLMDQLETTGLPFAPIARPHDLIEDPHLNAAGGLLQLDLPDGGSAKLPALPLEFSGERLGLRRQVPAAGVDTEEVLTGMGLTEDQIRMLRQQAIIR
jgi:crotonobetainyl-CoA:carnitine CoA-transferase CaiB-like acyl-CoA transferase